MVGKMGGGHKVRSERVYYGHFFKIRGTNRVFEGGPYFLITMVYICEIWKSVSTQIRKSF